MIGQQIGLQHLIPLAIDELSRNPLVAGDLYPGDLLASVLRAEPAFWRANPKLVAELDLALDRVPDEQGSGGQTEGELRDLVAAFRDYARTVRGD